ncbi:hypothetical protein H7K45_14600 [Mycobacterium yunnanensis]|uniref:CDGP domain-containing protein n=1 Tax=Mycobacterium yunnanensis TaxID=368477 RepID=A0A9X3BU20_9MYCO|nr:hypothetical protein [Mycobacterium yunnanensis]MCV7421775.1 hypothetical protein [Mycobacterium yunnanensis]
MTTTTRMRRVAGGAVLAAASALIALGAPAISHADATAGPGMGCETIHWGFLGNDRRQICDGPKQSDGTWQRTRTIYTPASNPPLTCNTYTYSWGSSTTTCRGGSPLPQVTQAQDTYPVAPDTVLPDEPGWLPPFTNNIL